MERFQFVVVWCVAKALGWLPRPLARSLGATLGMALYGCLANLRHTGQRNLQLAMPHLTQRHHKALLRGVYRSLGWQLAEFCRMERYTRQNVADWISYDGLEHYQQAAARGKGVLIVTGHLGAWELSSFYHSLMGFPMGMVIRRLDNRLLDQYVNRIRCMHGNRVFHKDDFARNLLSAMKRGESVGILMDTNMTPPAGVFVDFFGISACTPSGLARVALKTGAAVIPGFLVWERDLQRYVLHFEEEIRVAKTGDAGEDILKLTQQCTLAIESAIRRYPDQWLWIHRRWKTRPAGQARIY